MIPDFTARSTRMGITKAPGTRRARGRRNALAAARPNPALRVLVAKEAGERDRRLRAKQRARLFARNAHLPSPQARIRAIRAAARAAEEAE